MGTEDTKRRVSWLCCKKAQKVLELKAIKTVWGNVWTLHLYLSHHPKEQKRVMERKLSLLRRHQLGRRKPHFSC
ncbi:unnamed protein product [Leptosia nina]|uniref:Uncharacterized protein n=1 Tax=Leptosia nina TaxID=320188 RepID=A0AAV1J548_9NEOP